MRCGHRVNPCDGHKQEKFVKPTALRGPVAAYPNLEGGNFASGVISTRLAFQ